jgi:2-deoxy-D-gluconate 3-dehydrogenase
LRADISRASAGANIIFIVRELATVAPLIAEITAVNVDARISAMPCDLSNRGALLQIVRDLHSEQSIIDILIHCAGLQYRSPAEYFPDEEWDKIMGVNLTAGFQLSRELAKHWFETDLKGYNGEAGKRKKIIFIASMTTFTGSVEIPAYAASKGAIGQLTKALNNEWMGKGINVNAIAPGYIETELTSALRESEEKEKEILQRVPAGRWGTPEDLAGAVIHLCARSGDYIGGEIHAVDGGYLGR